MEDVLAEANWFGNVEARSYFIAFCPGFLAVGGRLRAILRLV
jgi:hypothetical protein